MDSLILQSPAKLNLYLKVLGIAPDGYCNIETVFERIDLCDTIILTLLKGSGGIEVLSDSEEIPLDENNLAFKAAQLVFERYHLSGGLRIYIKKVIPVGAGLGGGSSNAAWTILGLNQILGLRMEREELFVLGREIGADVNFFLCDKPLAVGRGRGDKLELIEEEEVFRKRCYVLIYPNLKIDTTEVYKEIKKNINRYLTSESLDVRLIASALGAGRDDKLKVNDLEDIVLSRWNEVAGAKKILQENGAKPVLMSGSGSTVFGIAEDKEEAERIRDSICAEKRGWQVFVCRSY